MWINSHFMHWKNWLWIFFGNFSKQFFGGWLESDWNFSSISLLFDDSILFNSAFIFPCGVILAFLTEKREINFVVPYDKLVIAVGTKSNTFGTPGILSQEEERIGTTGTNKHNVFFLKQLEHSRAIRNR